MTTITGQDVLDALMKDKRYSKQPARLLDLLNPLIISLPEILKEFLDKKVTAPLLWQARITFVEKYIEGEYFGKYIESLSEKDPMFAILGTREEIAKKGQEKLENNLESLKEYFKELGDSGEEVQDLIFRGLTILKKKVLAKYLAGELTFADLLIMQPAVFVYL